MFRQAVEQRLESRSVDLLSQALGGGIFEVMRLVDHEVVEVRQQAASDLRVGEQQGVVHDDDVRRLGLGAGAVDVAVLGRAADSDAVERVRGDARPQQLFPAMQPQLGAIARLRAVQPDQHLELETQLLRVLAWLDEEAPPAAQR